MVGLFVTVVILAVVAFFGAWVALGYNPFFGRVASAARKRRRERRQKVVMYMDLGFDYERAFALADRDMFDEAASSLREMKSL